MTAPTGRRHLAIDLDAVADHLDPVALGRRLHAAWHASGGQDVLGAERWVSLFRRAGYLLDGAPAPLPTEPVRLYRGGRRAEGMSWTTSREVAVAYATSTAEVGRRPVWTTLAPPSALLASRSGDAEVVVDPALLGEVTRAAESDPFREVRPAERCAVALVPDRETNVGRVFAGQRRVRPREVTSEVRLWWQDTPRRGVAAW